MFMFNAKFANVRMAIPGRLNTIKKASVMHGCFIMNDVDVEHGNIERTIINATRI